MGALLHKSQKELLTGVTWQQRKNLKFLQEGKKEKGELVFWQGT